MAIDEPQPWLLNAVKCALSLRAAEANEREDPEGDGRVKAPTNQHYSERPPLRRMADPVNFSALAHTGLGRGYETHDCECVLLYGRHSLGSHKAVSFTLGHRHPSRLSVLAYLPLRAKIPEDGSLIYVEASLLVTRAFTVIDRHPRRALDNPFA